MHFHTRELTPLFSNTFLMLDEKFGTNPNFSPCVLDRLGLLAAGLTGWPTLWGYGGF
jgi:hypothetical protein